MPQRDTLMVTDTSFFWAVGIENALIPELGVDQLGMTKHRQHWREDLEMARALGVSHIRYGLPWADLEPTPNQFDWSWSDAVLEHLQKIGLEPIWDFVHFGTPAWLEHDFRNPAYPEIVTRYIKAFVERYRSMLTKYTPLNEPYISAFFRGGNGMWPPFEVGHEGFVRALMPIVAGTRASIKAIRAAQPHAEIWLNDGADRYRASTPDLEPLAARLTLEHYAGLDLIEGRATTDSEMYDHLKHSGFDPLTLERYVAEPTPVDVIGLDYYPGTEHLISPRTSLERAPGDWGKRQDYALSADPQAIGIAASFVDYYRRYEKPLYLSETSSDSRRSEWLEYSTHECAGARAKGIPVIGYTWWPLFDHIDWNSGLTTLEGFVCPSGLYHLQPSLDHRSPSPLVPEFKQKIQQGLPTNLKQLQIPLPH